MNLKVGDMCVIVSARMKPEALGMECEITSIFITDEWDCVVNVPGLVNKRGGNLFNTTFASLRLKRPPSWNSWIYDTSDVDQTDKVPA